MNLEAFATDAYNALQDEIAAWIGSPEAMQALSTAKIDRPYLEGSVDPGLTQALFATSAAENVALIQGIQHLPEVCPCGRPDCANNDKQEDRDGLLGVYTVVQKPEGGADLSIYVADGLSELQWAKTVAHELAHHYINQTLVSAFLPDAAEEFTAETASYVALKRFGYDTSMHTVPYVGVAGAYLLEIGDIPNWFPDFVVDISTELTKAIEERYYPAVLNAA